MERETPWEVKFFWGEGWGFLGHLPTSWGVTPKGKAFEVDGEKCLI